MTKKVSKESQYIVNEKIVEVGKLFPEIISEGKINFEKLKLTLGEDIDGKEEKYSFNWAGRKESFKNIQTTAKGTVSPAKDESVNFDNTENLFIEGDNLEVLKLLQKAYFNEVKMIYIDPPYNTGKDFVYKDNFHNSIKAYLEQTGQSDGDCVKLTTNPETNGRFHSDWISMMYPRLFIARNLLRDDGLIFVSIDDNEVHNLRLILNEVFGEENFIGQIVRHALKGGTGPTNTMRRTHDYILVYSKDKENCEIGGLESEQLPLDQEDEKGKFRRGRELNKWGAGSRREDSPSMWFPIKAPNGDDVFPIRNDGTEGRWRWGKKKLLKAVADGDVIFEKRNNGTYIIYEKIRSDEAGTKSYSTLITEKCTNADGTEDFKKLFDGKCLINYPKPLSLIKLLCNIANTNNNDIILDFFAGSGTTGQAVMELNIEDEEQRKFILVQLPEKTDEKSEAYKQGYKTIAEICKERIRRVIKNVGKEQKGKLVKNGNLDLGFKVFKLEKSNYKIWEKYEGKDEKELKRQLELFKTPLISGYKEIDVIYECIIKEGYSLNSKIEKSEIKSNKVYKVTDGDLPFYICLDEKINDKTLDELNLKKDNMFICLDEALNDSKKKNLSIQCNLKTV